MRAVSCCIFCIVTVLADRLLGDDAPSPQAATPQSWAVILVGLDGDEEHAALFDATSAAWQRWLTERLGFPAEQVLLLRGATEQSATTAPSSGPATRRFLESTLQQLGQRLHEQDRLWLLTLGHGDYDGRRSHLHLPGPDLDERTLAEWLQPLPCREQIVWLTHSASGWALPALARPGRVVLTATAADAEFNATEFPHALATVALQPLPMLDADGNQSVSLLELLHAVVIETEQRFQADQRIATEQAQLDDNGDGRPTQVSLMSSSANSAAAPANPSARPQRPELAMHGDDGNRAAQIQVPYGKSEQPAASTPAVPDSETAPQP